MIKTVLLSLFRLKTFKVLLYPNTFVIFFFLFYCYYKKSIDQTFHKTCQPSPGRDFLSWKSHKP